MTYELKHAEIFMQMTITWTSGYDINEAVPFVEWNAKGQFPVRSPAGTLTFNRNSMCGMIQSSYNDDCIIVQS